MKTLLRVTPNISWMPAGSEGRLYQTDELPPANIHRTAFAFAFEGDQMLLTRLVKRGWDIPGGHIDPGESADQAAVRETLEEATVLVEPVELVGIQELEVFGSMPRGGWPEPLGAQLFYLCRVVKILPFVATNEAADRDFFSPEAIRAVPTMINHDLLYEIALNRVRNITQQITRGE